MPYVSLSEFKAFNPNTPTTFDGTMTTFITTTHCLQCGHTSADMTQTPYRPIDGSKHIYTHNKACIDCAFAEIPF